MKASTKAIKASNRLSPAQHVCASPRKRLLVTCFIGKQSQQHPSSGLEKVIVNKRQSPPQLVKEEQQSLKAALKAAGLSEDSNAAELSKEAVQGVLTTLRKGVDKQEQDLVKLEGAILLAEQLFHASGGSRMAAAGALKADPQAVDVWQVGMCCGFQQLQLESGRDRGRQQGQLDVCEG